MDNQSMSRELLDEYASNITFITETLKDITHLEESKAEAASDNRPDMMNGLIQREQAQILKLRGLEQKRLHLSDTLGWKGLSFQQVLFKTPDSHKAILGSLFGKLNTQIKQLTGAKDSSDRIISLRLLELQGFNENGVRPQLHDIYV